MDLDDIKTVAVLGAGTMGHGIAEAAALAGYGVVLYDIETKFLEGGLEKIRWSVSKLVEKGALSADKGQAVMSRIRGTLRLDDLADVGCIIEAVPEDIKAKRDVYSRLDKVNKRAIFASNTSTIPISEMADSTSRPDRFVGMHFFNPPVLMPLVEVIRGDKTSEETVELASAFAKSMGKQVVLCKRDVPGFVVNRIIGPIMNEAAWVVSRGEATIEQVDSAAVHKVGLPMGIFELADYTGLDVIRSGAEAIRQREPESIPVPPLIEEKVRKGKLGRKTGEGFYAYRDQRERPVLRKEVGENTDPLLFFSVGVNSAAWLIRNGVCSKEDLDLSTKLGLGFPRGILEMADGWGLDSVARTLDEKQKRYGERYAPDPLLREMVKRGALGVAAGQGFYDYHSSEKKLSEILLRKSPPIGWIILNRPQRHNAITSRMIEEIAQAATELESDGSIRVVVVSGEGGKAFSAGADLTSFESPSSARLFASARRWFEVFSMFERLSKPVLAAINGYALGGGCELALACDFRLASESSKIGLTETNLGLLPGAGGTQRLLRLVGLSKAKEMIYLGEELPAREALRVGLVDKVFANDEFQAGVEGFARRLAKRAPLSLRFAKHAINLALNVPADLGQLFEASSFGLLVATQDASEGITSFLSKREPEFKGE